VKKLRPKTTGKEQPGTDDHVISIRGYCQDVKAGRICLPAIRNAIVEGVSIPSVRSAGLVTALPITGGAGTDFTIEGFWES
jgi:hypothetical protein